MTIRSMKKRSSVHFIMYIVLFVWAIMTLYPLFFTLLSSFKTQDDMFSHLFGLPRKWVFTNYIEVFHSKILLNMFNSFMVSVFNVIFQLLAGAMVAFVLSRYQFKLKNVILVFFMAGIIVPIQAVLIPIAIMAKLFDGYNNLTYLTVLYVTFGLPYVVLMLTSYMKSIPSEIDESAIMDGCKGSTLFWKIILPLSIPALSTIGILAFFGSWNELIISLTLLKENGSKTISLGLINYSGVKFFNYPGQTAAVIISMLPTIVVYMLLQDKVINGITAGAVKG